MQSFLVVSIGVVVVVAAVVEELEDGFAFPVLDFLEAGLGDLLEDEDEEVVEKFEGILRIFGEPKIKIAPIEFVRPM
jgi:hypothetical protein